MTGLLKCALCAAAPFALLSATVAYAEPAATPDPAAVTDDLALPDAPTLTVSPNECGGGAPIAHPVLLRKTDVPDLEEFVETSLTLGTDRTPAQAALLQHELRLGSAVQLASADVDSCENGIAEAALLKRVAPPKAPHRA